MQTLVISFTLSYDHVIMWFSSIRYTCNYNTGNVNSPNLCSYRPFVCLGSVLVMVITPVVEILEF